MRSLVYLLNLTLFFIFSLPLQATEQADASSLEYREPQRADSGFDYIGTTFQLIAKGDVGSVHAWLQNFNTVIKIIKKQILTLMSLKRLKLQENFSWVQNL